MELQSQLEWEAALASSLLRQGALLDQACKALGGTRCMGLLCLQPLQPSWFRMLDLACMSGSTLWALLGRLHVVG